LSLRSKPGEGTMVEIPVPQQRVMAEHDRFPSICSAAAHSRRRRVHPDLTATDSAQPGQRQRE